MKKLSKTLSFLSFCILLSLYSMAQTDKSTWFLGGSASAGLSSSDNSWVSLRPDVGYFVGNNIALGTQVDISYSSFENSTNNLNFGLLPFIRLYLGSNNIKPFISASGGFSRNVISQDDISNFTTNSLLLNPSAGIAIFLNENIALESFLSYMYNSNGSFNIESGNSESVSNISLNVGFQIHFNNKVE